LFYGMNKQCYRCRMYLPATELQQYKGQLMCPYCLNDVRDQDRRAEERSIEGTERATGYLSGEHCDRCGRELTTVYYYGGRKLCQNCLDDAKHESKDVGGEKPPLPPYRITEKAAAEAGRRSFLERLFSEMLILLRLRKRRQEPEIVALEKPVAAPEQEASLGQEITKEEPGSDIMTEGPQSKHKRKRKKAQDVSFSSYVAPAQAEKTEKKKKGKKTGFGGLKED
jgi:hypothetical protein